MDRLEALQNLPILPITPEVGNLAAALIQSGSLPAEARSDAIHVAVATLAGVDFLLTWNCRHLANPHLQKQLRAVMAARGITGRVIPRRASGPLPIWTRLNGQNRSQKAAEAVLPGAAK
jgi:hypothetical protein